MRKLGFARSFIILLICLFGVAIAAQSFGTMDVGATPAQAQVSAQGSLEYGLAGLFALGSLVVLIRPRRRIESTEQE